MTPDDGLGRAGWTDAEAMTLRCTVESLHAVGLVETLLEALPMPAGEKALRPSALERRRIALRALMADLMRLEAKGVAGFHGMARKDFPMKLLGFAYDVFVPLKDAMVASGFLAFYPGRKRWAAIDNFHTGERGELTQRGGWKARFRLTPKALKAAQDAGVDIAAWGDHWRRPASLQDTAADHRPTTPLVALRATKERRGGVMRTGADVPFDMNLPALEPIVEDLREHNDFTRSMGVSGVDFIGLRRIFNNGDEPGHAWRKGGRFYSLRAPGMGKAYETLSGDKRRTRIRLGGERVGEVDMSASQLRLLYALLGEELPASLSGDLYALAGIHREAVKLVVTQAIGRENTSSKKWGADAVRGYAKDRDGRSLEADHPFAAALEATLAGHPILKRLGHRDTPSALGLQYVESEVVRRAMACLRLDGVPSLPVHDSLIVPLSKLELAAGALCDAFREAVGLELGFPTKMLPSMSFKVSPKAPEHT